MKSVMVTGQSGQVATALAEHCAALSRDGIEVAFCGRPKFDMSQPEQFVSALRNANPDLVVNVAAYTQVDQAQKDHEIADAINHVSVAKGAQWCNQTNTPWIQISTDYVFDGKKTGAYVESDPMAPHSVYGSTKAQAELALHKYCPQHLIIRTAWVYSQTGQNFVKTMLRLAKDRDELRVVNDQHGSPTSANQIARGLATVLRAWQAGTLEFGHTYHLVADGTASWHEFAYEIFQISAEFGGPSCKVTAIPTVEYPTPAPRPQNSVLNNTKFVHTFNHEIGDWRLELRSLVKRLLTNRA